MSVPSAYLSARMAQMGHRQWGDLRVADLGQQRRRMNARTPEGDPHTICGKRGFTAVEPAEDFRTFLAGNQPCQALTTRPMSTDNPTIQSIYRYPVKGLTPEPLERTGLAVG